MSHTGRLAVQVGDKDGRGGFGETELPSPTDRFDLLADAARLSAAAAFG